uniref:Titin n=1 Tax=Gouania willdenowi TaxID=441366 RepID=A0A8C5DVR8_GOUWI
MWQAPKCDGGTPIFSYHIERKDKIGLRWVKCNKRKVKDLQFRATGLLVGHEYKFRISAENAAGLSAPSVSSPFYKATDELFKPGPPCNPRVLDTTKSSITVAWNRPTYDGGSEVTGYLVETCVPSLKAEEEEWTIVSPKEGLRATSFTILNLKENQEYKINISAINSEGIGYPGYVPDNAKAEDRLIPPEMDLDAELRKMISLRACCSLRLFVPIRGRPTPQARWTKDNGEPVERATIDSTSSYTLLVIENVNRFDSGKYNLTIENSSGSKTATVQVKVLDTPSAPQNLKISSVTNEAVILTWDPPVNNGGVNVKNYIVEKRESTRKAYATVNANCHQTTFKVDQLLEGCNYYFRVLAENEYGIGLPIETGESVKVSQKPQPPGTITLKDVTKNSVTLSWEKPEHDGGSRVGCYIVEVLHKGAEKWAQAVIVKETEATITGLNAGEEYMFRVAARNEKGTSDPRQIGVPVIVKDLVVAPVAKMLFNTFSVLAGEDLTVDVPYVARPKAAVSWVKDGQPLKRTTRVNFSSTETLLNLSIKEATKDDVGHYTITLSNTAGETTAIVGIVVLDKPGQPGGPVKVEEVTSDSVTISWNPPEYEGGCTIKNYIVEKRDTSTTEWMVVSANLARTKIKAGRLKHGSEYQFRIAAENRYGKGPVLLSECIVAQYPYKLPGPPGTPSIAVCTKDSMVVAWNEPVNDGGSAILGYHLERKERNSILWVKLNKSLITDQTFKSKPLQEGCSYYFRVLAENAHGVGLPTATVDPLKVSEVPQTPKSLMVTDQTKTSISLAWEKPEYDGGSRVLQYLLEVQLKGQEKWNNVNTFKTMEATVSNLNPGEEYLFRVTAINDKGKSEPKVLAGPVMAKDLVFEPDVRPQFSCYSVHVGKDMDINIPIFGRPKPAVTWTKDGAPLKFTTRVNINNTPTHTTLSIKEAATDDGGMYGVTVINPAGQRDTTVEIIVLDKPGAPSGPVRFDEITTQSITISWDPPKHNGGCQVSNYIVQKRDTTTTTWENVNINCARTSIKVPRLKTGAEYQFRIIAQNRYGKSCGLDSSSPSYNSGPITASDNTEAPKFSIDPAFSKTIIINAGETFTLDADVRGKPLPTIKWFKNEKPFENTLRQEIRNTETHAMIVIKDSIRIDSGVYTLQLTNEAGTETVPFKVIVLDKCTLAWRAPM